MARLTDGNKTVEITMCVWNGNGYNPDWSNDFFSVGDLEYDEEKEAHIVKDVDYCVEQAEDWKNSRGDYTEDDADPDDKIVEVEEI